MSTGVSGSATSGGISCGWSFVVGKTASCAAMALTVGAYVWPGQAHAVAVAAVVALTAVNYGGVQKSAWLTRAIVAVVLAVLAAVVVVCLGSGEADAGRLGGGASGGAGGVLQAAGLLFFAFAGYARIATLGEDVRDPARTIPRAIPLALGIALVVYAAVAVAVLSVLGSGGWGGPRLRWPTRCGRPGCRGWCPWCGWGPPWPRSGHSWRSSWASPAPRSPWPGTGISPALWPPCTLASGCRTGRSWL